MREISKRFFGARAIAAAVAVAATLCAPSPRATAQTGEAYFVFDADAARFPAVQFTLRAIDTAKREALEVSAGSLRVFEDGAAVAGVTVTPRRDLPLNTLFVIDLGAASNIVGNAAFEARLRTALVRFVDAGAGYFSSGKDRVGLITRENATGSADSTQVRIGATTEDDNFRNAARTFALARSRGSTQGLAAVDFAVQELAGAAAKGAPSAVVFISRRVELPAGDNAARLATTIAEAAQRANIAIHAVQTEPGTIPAASRAPFEALSRGTGGSYSQMSAEAVESVTESVFRRLQDLRQAYTVGYTSANAAAARRTITVGQPAAGNPTIVAGSYQVQPGPPSVTIGDFATLNPILQFRSTTDGRGAFNPPNLRVPFSVTWPDGFTRTVRSVEVRVSSTGGSAVAAAFSPTERGRFEASVNLAGITGLSAESASLNVVVTVVDSLGLQNASRTERVSVDFVPAERPAPPPADPLPAILAVAGGVAVLAAGLGVALVIRKRGRATPGPAQAPRPAVLATLTVLDGPDNMIGEPIALTRDSTRIGRGRDQADVVFYADGESSISRLHCSVDRLPDGSYVIVDRGSRNGTRVDGSRLEADVPFRLSENAEIILGNASSRGIRLRFNGDPTARDDRTRL